jgi:hypothetical protein
MTPPKTPEIKLEIHQGEAARADKDALLARLAACLGVATTTSCAVVCCI